MSAKKILDACQSLYETHRIITYPRSDCSHLPEGHLAEISQVLTAISKSARVLDDAAGKLDTSFRSKAWNDKKVTAHHAIIPTANAAGASELSDVERSVYELIARRYVIQFFPAFEYLQTKLELDVAGERFSASGRVVRAQGWKGLASETPNDDDTGEKNDEATNAALPPGKKGDQVRAASIALSEKTTQPPKAFTDASLIQAMCNIARYVADPKAKKILAESDGIGTPATRAAIIETLFQRNFIRREKKKITSTPTGRSLIKILPEVATTPDMTAVWEAAIRSIHEGDGSLDAFLSRVNTELTKLIREGQALGALAVGETHPCWKHGCPGRMRRLKGKNGHFWSCRQCRATCDDASGRPAPRAAEPSSFPRQSSRKPRAAASSPSLTKEPS